jgi:hypothetical protein
MSTDIGGIKGETKSEDGSDALPKDYEYSLVMHGNRSPAFGGTHDVIDDGDEQRVHLQSYFADGPYPNDGDDQYPDSVYYRIEPSFSGSDKIDFANQEPDNPDLGSGYSFQPGFSIGVPLSPFLTGNLASITLGQDGGFVGEKDYEYTQWDIRLDANGTFPTSQDDSDGVQIDIVDANKSDYSTHYVEAESNYTWFQYVAGDNVGANYYTTLTPDFTASFDVVNE